MQIGTVIVYRERGRLALGVITTPPSKTSKGKTQVEIVGEDGKKSVLIPDRIVLDCAQTVSPGCVCAHRPEWISTTMSSPISS